MENRQIWATDIKYLNDSQEFQHTIKLFSDRVEAYMKRSDRKLSKSETCIAKDILVCNEAILDGNALIFNGYVASFSTKEDDLAQWRAYGRKEGGYSLGFDFEYLEGVAKTNNCKLARCIYDPKKQQKILDQIMCEVIDSLKESPFYRQGVKPVDKQTEIALEELEADTGLSLTQTKCLGELSSRLSSVAPILKHRAFEAEQEWRLVARRPFILKPPIGVRDTEPKLAVEYYEDTLHFREGSVTPIPYIRLQFPGDRTIGGLKQIWVGPSSHTDLAVNAVKMLALRQGYEAGGYGAPANKWPRLEIRKSAVPYRSW